jgi:preprotein translocase subunit SecA
MLNFDGFPRHMRRSAERWLTEICAARDRFQTLDRDAVSSTARDLVAERSSVGEGETDLPGWFVEPVALAAVAAERALGVRPHETQLCAAMVLCDSTVAEMRTGEGKTLAGTLAAAAFALVGRHVHVMTANTYLASRDAEWMEPLYSMLGLEVSALGDSDDVMARKGRYRADVVYGTAAQFGFDYLNDNRVSVVEAVVQHTRDVALVDEADALLLDDARTPLILSAPHVLPGEVELVERAAKWASTLSQDDVEVEFAERRVSLTELSIVSAEQFFGVSDLFDHPALAAVAIAAATAEFVFCRDVDYVVSDEGAVVLVDQSTGRLQPDRRWRAGLHEAVEAKEGVAVNAPLPTVAMVTVPSFLALYGHVSAMTGTAVRDAAEFESRYSLTVCSVPTHVPSRRVDAEDLLFEDRSSKLAQLVVDVVAFHRAGRPVLVGAPTIADAHDFSEALSVEGVPHQVLSAHDPDAESSIVAAAGRPGSVVVATNMAGRGVDIVLGGDLAAELAAVDLSEADVVRVEHAARREQVIASGGLVVLGTARHEARRVDDQLRGRAGRQGEPGFTQFYLSLDDDLVAHFGSGPARAAVARAARAGKVSHSRLSALIAQAQEHAESQQREARAELARVHVVYDAHRQEFYRFRAQTLVAEWDVLLGDWLSRGFTAAFADPLTLAEVAEEEFGSLLSAAAQEGDFSPAQWAGLVKVEPEWLTPELSAAIVDVVEGFGDVSLVVERLADGAFDAFVARHVGVEVDVLGAVLRLLLTSELDHAWTRHLADLDALARGVRLRSVSGIDWRTEWVADAHELFVRSLNRVFVASARMLLAATVDFTWDDEPVVADRVGAVGDGGE